MNMHHVYRPFQHYFRTRRMRRFVDLFQPTPATRIVDVGGYELNWTLVDATPRVVLVNLDTAPTTSERFESVRGDGRDLAIADRAFDIAYSNSVIEHVGTPADQQAFADEIRRVAPRYYVQTPNRWFVIEPHLVAAGIHFLPRAVLRRLVRWLSVWGWIERPTQAKVDALLASIHLLDRAQLQRLFPDAEIHEERVLGMTKSLIAVRR